MGYTQNESLTNYIGNIEQTITKHKKSYSDLEMVISENFTYSNQGRLLTHTHKINNEPLEFLLINSYDKLGQLSIKQVGGNGLNRLQNVNYKYNIRGWLTDINNVDEEMNVINDDLFSFRMNYQNPENNGESLYNGNICETYWKSRSDNQIRMYDYDYDGLNRLQSAKFMNINQGIIKTYNESLTYDKNGNIISLIRRGGYENPLEALIIDNLTYQYDPNSINQLKKVVDLSNSQQGFKDDSNGTLAGDLIDDFLYDSYGNMTKDENKNITSIIYNNLNLPSKIIFGTGSIITYTYDATGVKLKKVVTSNNTISTTEYLGGFQYNNNVLQFFPHAEGYVKHTLWVNGPLQAHFYNYIYQYKDHLGNVRINYTWNDDLNELSIVEEDHYYPFGLKHGNYNLTKQEFEPEVTPIGTSSIRLVQVPNSGYQYQFQEQEFQDELGLNWYSFKYRNYDPAIGRFLNIDPLSEKYSHQSHYNFSENRVIDARELEGLESYIVTGRAFIPQDKLDNPTPWGKYDSFKGDNRSYYSATSNDYRVEQSVRLDFDKNESETLSNVASQSIAYDKNEKIIDVSKAEIGGEVNHNINNGEVNFSMIASNELALAENFLTPSIDGVFNITISPNSDGTFNFCVDVIKVDGFPAYEIWVTDEKTNETFLLFGRNPIESNETL